MLPRATDHLRPCTGISRKDASDTRMEEVLTRPVDGGDHFYLKVRKTGMTTSQAMSAVARAAGLERDMVSHTGAKDRHADCVQWFAVPKEPIENPGGLGGAGYKKLMKVQEVKEGAGPLSPEDLDHLTVRLRLREAAQDEGFMKAQAIMDHLRKAGVPNYIGGSVLGKGPNFAKWGKLICRGKRLPPRVPFTPGDRHRYVLAYQAQLFNRYVAQRLEGDSLGSAVDGDVVMTGLNQSADKWELAIAESAADVDARIASWEAVPMGPLWGPGCDPAEGDSGALEARLMDEWTVATRKLPQGSRRAIRFRPGKAEIQIKGLDLFVECSIPSDAFASILAEELLHPQGHLQ